jgi:hypothetical protein
MTYAERAAFVELRMQEAEREKAEIENIQSK